ncbi:MAG: hypothetical protein Q7S90_05340, partial [Rubrivivax sp.]|nr:hypothetical protein [Rubrivivax sp.]
MTDTPTPPEDAAPDTAPTAPQDAAPTPPQDPPASEVTAGAPSAITPPAAVELSPAACAARLAELFPALFSAGRALPIKLRVQADIQ